MKVDIRPIETTDDNDIQEFLFPNSNVVEIRNNIDADIQKMNLDEIQRTVAVTEGKVIGQCDFRKSSSPIKQHIVEVTGLVVNEKYQNKGIATKLIEAGIKWSKKNKLEIIVLSVRKGTVAETFYFKQGFTIYGELENGIKEPWGEKRNFDEVFLYKRIANN